VRASVNGQNGSSSGQTSGTSAIRAEGGRDESPRRRLRWDTRSEWPPCSICPSGVPASTYLICKAKQFVSQLIERLGSVYIHGSGDDEWSAALEAALTTTRRHDLKHGHHAAYGHGCVCSDCREYQRARMANDRR
jgi:hypothetical protein